MAKMKWLLGVLVAAIVLWTGSALADEHEEDAAGHPSSEWSESHEDQQEKSAGEEVLEAALPTPELRLSGPDALKNIVIEGGAGISAYTGELGERLDPGVSWNIRTVIGARSLLGLEVNYFGAVNGVQETPTDLEVDLTDVALDGTVRSNSLEGLLRISFLSEDVPVKPYVAGGASYFRHDSTEALFDDKDSFGLPVAAGVQAFVMDNVAVGARAEYKKLLGDTVSGDQWGGLASIGANF